MEILRELSESCYFAVGNQSVDLGNGVTLYPSCKDETPAEHLFAVGIDEGEGIPTHFDVRDFSELPYEAFERETNKFSPLFLEKAYHIDWEAEIVKKRLENHLTFRDSRYRALLECEVQTRKYCVENGLEYTSILNEADLNEAELNKPVFTPQG